MLTRWKLTYRTRNKLLCSNQFFIVCIVFLIVLLFVNQKLNTKHKRTHVNKSNDNKDVQAFIDHIQSIPLLEQQSMINITYDVIGEKIPPWVNQYEIMSLFNFYWLQNGAYLWHTRRILDLKQNSKNLKRSFSQMFSESYDQNDVHNYLHEHPEYGIIIDTASDPVRPLLPSLPRASLPWQELCEHYRWLNNRYKDNIRMQILSPFPFKPLITYALYDITIDTYNQSKHLKFLKKIHYDEIVYIFNSQRQMTNKTYFVKQILPRIIRLLALVPEKAVILLPYLKSQVYVKEYIDILLEREIITDKNRFIDYDPNEIYHANVLYSTSSPRSDLIMLNQVLAYNESSLQRKFILLIRNNFDDHSYFEMIQTIDQFELPEGYDYLRIQEYEEESDNLNQTSYLFRHARIIIGMHTDILSHIVWCLPGTHIIEVVKETMTTDYYEMSLQLKLNYWLAMTTTKNQIDIVHFRNLMMKVFTDIDA